MPTRRYSRTRTFAAHHPDYTMMRVATCLECGAIVEAQRRKDHDEFHKALTKHDK